VTADTVHETSLAVWDIAPAVAAGEAFSVKVGAKSSTGCALDGCRVEVLDGEAVVAAGCLGEAPWPGSSALYWTEIALRAPAEPGRFAFTVRFDAGALVEPHVGATSSFNVSVVTKPEHTLTVKLTAAGVPVDEAYIRLGPYRAITDGSGMAQLKTSKGNYELVIWKAGYDVPVTTITVEADAVVPVEAQVLPEDDPDAIWTA
jgi:hypothetical protein